LEDFGDPGLIQAEVEMDIMEAHLHRIIGSDNAAADYSGDPGSAA
jgi:hypothetical protein